MIKKNLTLADLRELRELFEKSEKSATKKVTRLRERLGQSPKDSLEYLEWTAANAKALRERTQQEVMQSSLHRGVQEIDEVLKAVERVRQSAARILRVTLEE